MHTRQPLRILTAVMATVALLAFVPWCWKAASQSTYAAQRAFLRWRDAQPPRPLPLRSEDRLRYPRSGFGFVLMTRGLRVDTFAGTVRRFGMLPGPDTTISLRFSDAQMDSVYDAVLRMRFFEPPKRRSVLRYLRYYDSDNGLNGPLLMVQAGMSKKAVFCEDPWSIYSFRTEPLPDEWKRLDRLMHTIEHMVLADSAYRALPPAYFYPSI